LARFSEVKDVTEPKDPGSAPVNSFEEKSRIWRRPSWVTSGGRDPFRPVPANSLEDIRKNGQC